MTMVRSIKTIPSFLPAFMELEKLKKRANLNSQMEMEGIKAGQAPIFKTIRENKVEMKGK